MEPPINKPYIKYFVNIIARNIKYLPHRPAQIDYIDTHGLLIKYQDKIYICVIGRHISSSENIFAAIKKNDGMKNINLVVHMYDPYININILVPSDKDIDFMNEIDIERSEYIDLTNYSKMKYPNKKMSFEIMHHTIDTSLLSVEYIGTGAVINQSITNMSAEIFKTSKNIKCAGSIIYNKSNRLIGICNSDIVDNQIAILSFFRLRNIIKKIYENLDDKYFGSCCLPLIINPLTGKLNNDFKLTTTKKKKQVDILLKKNTIITEINGNQIDYKIDGSNPLILDDISKRKISVSSYIDNNYSPLDKITIGYITDGKTYICKTELITYDDVFMRMTLRKFIRPQIGFVFKQIDNLITVQITKELIFIFEDLNIKPSNKNMVDLFNRLKADFSYKIEPQYIVIDRIISDDTSTTIESMPIFSQNSEITIPLIDTDDKKTKISLNGKDILQI